LFYTNLLENEKRKKPEERKVRAGGRKKERQRYRKERNMVRYDGFMWEHEDDTGRISIQVKGVIVML
jgi:hypothetical protein